jgi:hypothetical protein
MAVGAFTLYGAAKEGIAKATIDLDGETIRAMLLTSAYTPVVNTHALTSDLAGELPTADGYTAGGAALTGVTVTRSGGTVTFDAADVSWTASGAGLTARYLVLYADGATDRLLGYILLDDTPANVVVNAGTTLTIQWSASGIFTLS